MIFRRAIIPTVICLLLMAFVSCGSNKDNNKDSLEYNNNDEKTTFSSEAETEKQITMYAADGRTRVTPESQVEDYKAVGWYTVPVCIMYAADGRTRVTLKSQVEDYKAVGWYTEPVCIMYAADGRTRVTLESQVEDYKTVGWYTEPVCIMYAADGRTRVTLESQVEDYKAVGWYETSEEANLHNSILSELELKAIRSILYAIGNNVFDDISILQDSRLAYCVMELADITYLTFNGLNMVPYTQRDDLNVVTSDEMSDALMNIFKRKLKSYVNETWNKSDNEREYAVYANNGRGGYGETVINGYSFNNGIFTVDYTVKYYYTAEHSRDKIADDSYNNIARFKKTTSQKYPMQLIDIKSKEVKISGPDFSDGYWIDYASQYRGGDMYKFTKYGTVQKTQFAYQPYSEMSSKIIKYDYDETTNKIEIDSQIYFYDKDKDYFYREVNICVNGYMSSPDEYEPNIPGEELQFVKHRKIVFHYDSIPDDARMETDSENDIVRE